MRTVGGMLFLAGLIVWSAACGGNVRRAPVSSATPPPPVQAGSNDPFAAASVLAPRIDSFTVEPRTIERGQSAMLRWMAENTTQLSIDHGVGAVEVRGNREVSPISTTTYILSARGAGGTDSRSVTVEVATPILPPPAGATESKTSGPDVLASEVQDAYFDYDSTEIREDARQVLTRDAEVLKRILAGDPSFIVIIEGHCDERGSSEYNLGLGDRRATSAKDLLVRLGVPADRLRTVSYGKERPACTDANEACYQHNRRDHLAPAR